MGSIDTNGIWQYTEADIQPTFSDLLNLLAGSTSDAVAAHYASLASRITPLEEDTGVLTTGVVAPAGDWTLGSQFATRVSGRVELQIALTYAGAPITVPADGNIPDSLCAVVAAGWRPRFNRPLVPDGGGPVLAARCAASSGQIAITAVSPGAIISTGFSTTLSGDWHI